MYNSQLRDSGQDNKNIPVVKSATTKLTNTLPQFSKRNVASKNEGNRDNEHGKRIGRSKRGKSVVCGNTLSLSDKIKRNVVNG